MLSSVLRSERAVQVNIAIMRAFVSLRGLLASDDDLARRILHLGEKYVRQFAVVFDAIRQMLEGPVVKKLPERRMAWVFGPAIRRKHRRRIYREVCLLQRV